MSANAEIHPAISRMRRRLERRSRGGRKTAKSYILRLNLFLKWAGVTPGEFLAGMESGRINLVRLVNDYLDYLHAKKLAPATMAGHVSAIKKFVEVNTDTIVNWKRVELPKLKRVEEDMVPTKEVIRRVLLHANAKERSIALVAASSGLREETMTLLTIEDLDLKSEPDIGIIRVPASKSKDEVKYVTFITPEAREGLKAYLSTRGTLEPGDPVFATRFGIFYSRPDKLARRWLTPLDKAGLGHTSRKWRDYRFHTLRKFFRTAMEYAGVSKSFRERMLGHSGEYLDSAYFGPEFDKLMEQYRRAIPHLTVEEFVGEERMQTLEGELGETKERLAEMTKAFESMKDVTVGRMMRELEAGGVDTSKTPHEIAKEMGLVDQWKKEIEASNEPAQKVIAEEELVAHLSEGWRFVAQLNNGSGKIIVER